MTDLTLKRYSPSATPVASLRATTTTVLTRAHPMR